MTKFVAAKTIAYAIMKKTKIVGELRAGLRVRRMEAFNPYNLLLSAAKGWTLGNASVGNNKPGLKPARCRLRGRHLFVLLRITAGRAELT